MFDIALLIAVVVAITQLVKTTELVHVKYMPVLSLALGVVASVFYVPGTVQEQILYGIMIGLSAAGLFDQSKIITKKLK